MGRCQKEQPCNVNVLFDINAKHVSCPRTADHERLDVNGVNNELRECCTTIAV